VNWQAFLEDEASTAVEDMAPDDTIYGIELLNANEPVAARRMVNLLLINEATGQQVDVPLTIQ